MTENIKADTFVDPFPHAIFHNFYNDDELKLIWEELDFYTKPDKLLDEVAEMGEKLSSFAPFVPRTMKAMVHFGMDASLASALMLEKFAQGALVQTDDKAEGINSFLEKRKPNFKGK